MNQDQICSLSRSVMKILAGLLAAHGLQNEATLLNTPDTISAVLLLVSMAWSHFSHSSPTTPPAGGNGGKLAALLLLASAGFFGAHAQTNAPAAPPSFWGGLSEAGQAFANSFKSDTNAMQSTNWVAIPFASYDISQKKIGGGIALVYPVNDLLYVGARLENINGTWTTPSIQVQLKKTLTAFGLKLTPYGVGGTAIVNGNVAAYTGAGAYANLFSFNIASHPLTVGVTGDYEAWGGLPAPCGTKRANGGLLLNYSW